MVLTEDESVTEEASPRAYTSYERLPCVQRRLVVHEQRVDYMVRLI